MTPVVVVHGGAGRVADELATAAVEGVARAAQIARDVLTAGGDAEQAVVDAVRALEDDPTYNAGRGSCLTRDETFEMDASVMRSSDLRSGAVAAIPNCLDPVLVAQAVLRDGRHHLLAGAGAEAFARASGVGRFGRDLVWSQKAQRRFDAATQSASRDDRMGQADTVGAVALDQHGTLAVACSTGGVLLKVPGRVGDSPLCGAGFYASGTLGAGCATGVGEAILTHVAAYEALRRVADGESPNLAAQAVCDVVAAHERATCGIILVTPRGETGIAHRCPHMSWARAVGDRPVEGDLAMKPHARL